MSFLDFFVVFRFVFSFLDLFFRLYLNLIIFLIPNLQKAKKKQIEKKSPKDLGVEITPHIEIVEVTDPPVREAGVKVKDVDELLDKLKQAGRI